MNHGEIVSFLWGVADLIRDTFRRGKYQDVILPLTVLRRLDCVLAPTKARVLERQAALKKTGLKDLEAQLRRASGFAFYNTSRYNFDKLVADHGDVARNLRNYIAGFSPNMRVGSHRFPTFRCSEEIDLDYLLMILQTEQGRALMEVNSPGAAGRNKTIRLDQFIDEEIPLPPLLEQREIIHRFRSDEERLAALVVRLRDGIAALKEVRTALISAAVTGKIDVRESTEAGPVSSAHA
jgi:hypothetical protein